MKTMILADKILDYFLSFEGIVLCNVMLQKSAFWNVNKIKNYQFKKMKELLLICEKEIPYYKTLFKKIGFEVERDFHKLKDIEKIPITTKKNVKEHKEEFINPKYRHNCIICKTSGSTGMPLEVCVSKNQWVMEQGVVWRQWKWAGYHFRDKMAIVRSYTPKNGILIKKERVRNFIYYSPYNLTNKNMDMYLNHMIKENVKFLRGYPSSLKTLAEYIINFKHQIPKIKGIFVASEVLNDADRRIIEKAFKAKVFNYYGMAECVVAMGDCNYHKGLHIYEEYGYVELLDTVDIKIKKLVGTNLHNYAMPLLRYETNDLVVMDGNNCVCGRNLKVVQNVLGRKSDIIKLIDREIPLTNFYTMLEHYPMIGSWQIVQHSRCVIELIVEKKLDDKTLSKLTQEFALRLPENVEFNISYEKEFVRKGEGKKLAFVSLL